MKIVIIDDTAEERELAKQIVENAGHEALVFSSVSEQGFFKAVTECDGVLTDLLMLTFDKKCTGLFCSAESLDRHIDDYYNTPIPGGLIAALAAQSAGKPFVICTSASGGKHHEASHSWMFDGFIKPLMWSEKSQMPALPNLRLGWNEAKDWSQALNQLLKLIAKEPGYQILTT